MDKRKKVTFKRWLAVILAVTMIFSAVSSESVFAVEMDEVSMDEMSVDEQVSSNSAVAPDDSASGVEIVTDDYDMSSLIIQQGAFPEPVKDETEQILSGYPDISEGYLYNLDKGVGEEFETAEQELTLKENIVNAVENRLDTLSVYAYGIELSEARVAVAAVINEHPEYWFVKHVNFSYITREDGTKIAYTVYFSYFSEEEVDYDIVEEEIYKCLSTVKDSMSDLEKALAIHDYIVMDCQYDYRNYLDSSMPDNDFSMLGPIYEKTAVCQGYALAFQYYMNVLGIPCETISGGNHMWNLVEINGEWYHLDCTWDDPVWDMTGRVRHTYFLGSDTLFAGTETGSSHQWDVDSFRACTDTTYDDLTTVLKSSSSQMVYHADDMFWYFVDEDNQIMKTRITDSFTAQELTVIKKVNTSWPVWDKPGYTYVGSYMTTAASEDYIFYHTANKIYRINYDGSGEVVVAVPDTSVNGYIYGIKLEGSKLKYCLMKEPSVEERTYGYVTETGVTVKETMNANLLQFDIPDEAIIFDGKTHEISVSPKSGVEGIGTITVFYTDENNEAVDKPQKCGTYQVYVTVGEGENYKELSRKKLGQFTIAPKNVNVSLQSDTTESIYGESVRLNITLSGTVQGTKPTGDVYIKEGDKIVADHLSLIENTVGSNNGNEEAELVYTTEFRSSDFSVGHHAFVANYVPGEDDQYSTSASDSVTVLVKEKVSPTDPTNPGNSGIESGENNAEKQIKIGDTFISGKLEYKVLSYGNSNSVTVEKSTDKKLKSVTIPNTVTYQGVSFTVTQISGKAFQKCSKLKKITIKAISLKKVGKKAFSGIHERAVIKVPKKNLKSYKKILKGKGQKKTVKIKA